MKQITEYRFLTITGKLRCGLKIIIDDERNPEYVSNNNGNQSTTITFYPTVTMTMLKSTLDENGQRVQVPWIPNDSLSLSKFNLPIFINELKSIMKDMKISDLYTYHGKRLELNEEIADKVRRVFMVNTTSIELSPIIIINDEDRFEGIKIKFNNEQSTIALTLNEITSLISNLDHLNVDSVAMLLYLNYINRPDKPKSFDTLMNAPKVDIVPKNSTDFV